MLTLKQTIALAGECGRRRFCGWSKNDHPEYTRGFIEGAIEACKSNPKFNEARFTAHVQAVAWKLEERREERIAERDRQLIEEAGA